MTTEPSSLMIPLQVIDSFLLDYHLGHVLVLGLVVTTLGAVPLGSRRVIAINTVVFGLLFMLTPVTVMPSTYLFLGLALLVVGPILYVTAR
jgi:hypothetical protein